MISQPILRRLMWRNWDFFRGTFPVLTDTNSEIAKLPDSLPRPSSNLVPTVTQSHTGLHDRPIENSIHELAKLSLLFFAFRKCLKLQNSIGTKMFSYVCRTLLGLVSRPRAKARSRHLRRESRFSVFLSLFAITSIPEELILHPSQQKCDKFLASDAWKIMPALLLVPEINASFIYL